MWTEIPARPKGQGTAGQGGRGEPGETSGEQRRLRTRGSGPATRDPARPSADSPRRPVRRRRRRDLPQSRVSGLALGMSTREYTAAKWSRLIRTTFLQTMSCRCPRAPGLSRPPPPGEPSTPARIPSAAGRKGTSPPSAARPGMAGERWARAAATASKLSSAGAALSGGGGGFCLLGGISAPPVPPSRRSSGSFSIPQAFSVA